MAFRLHRHLTAMMIGLTSHVYAQGQTGMGGQTGRSTVDYSLPGLKVRSIGDNRIF